MDDKKYKPKEVKGKLEELGSQVEYRRKVQNDMMVIDGTTLTDTTYRMLINQIKSERNDVEKTLSIIRKYGFIREKSLLPGLYMHNKRTAPERKFTVTALYDNEKIEYDILPDDEGIIGYETTYKDT